LSYREYERRSREGRAEPASAAAAPAPAATGGIVRPAENEERPSRLN